MKFLFDASLIEYMKQTGRHNIIVELVTCETSDIEIAELHVHAADDKRAAYFKDKKRYRSFPGEIGEVLLPRFALTMEEEIHFWLKRFWCFKSVGYSGIKI